MTSKYNMDTHILMCYYKYLWSGTRSMINEKGCMIYSIDSFIKNSCDTASQPTNINVRITIISTVSIMHNVEFQLTAFI